MVKTVSTVIATAAILYAMCLAVLFLVGNSFRPSQKMAQDGMQSELKKLQHDCIVKKVYHYDWDINLYIAKVSCSGTASVPLPSTLSPEAFSKIHGRVGWMYVQQISGTQQQVIALLKGAYAESRETRRHVVLKVTEILDKERDMQH